MAAPAAPPSNAGVDTQMSKADIGPGGDDDRPHQHVFLGAGHASVERRAWAVIVLCTAMMLLELVGGWMFGSLALVADGLHMSTHAMAMLIAAFAYRFARRHATDPRFSFGTGKLGDLAGFTNAIVLALIALFIGYEAVMRIASPVQIAFAEAIPIAVLGLVVNLTTVWLLSGGAEHGHDHSRGHAHRSAHDHSQPHAHRDHNLRAIFMHVAADATVSVLAIAGLSAARYLGWLWMDPLMGIIGATVIAVWAAGLLRDTGRVLLDMTPDAPLAARIRAAVEEGGDRVLDLHLWRLGPGHLAAILSVAPAATRDALFYRGLLRRHAALSHITVEVVPGGARRRPVA
jgi:cation diffusion facilitator family transporter